jgi:hypothetical protein
LAVKFVKKLQNPFALVGQGFLLGAVLFWTTHPGVAVPAGDQPVASQSILAAVQS